MEFSLQKSIEVLSATPATLDALLGGLSGRWVENNEGENTWSPYDVVGHLVVAEKTDWVVRMEVILSDATDKTFPPFDRFAHFIESNGKTLKQLLDDFKAVREKNINILLSKNLTAADLAKTGIHPAFGEVTLGQLLSTWTVHDLNHLVQIARVMAKQYSEAVGPWNQYLSVLKR
ncbi:MAG TPA: DinB family protein [Chitinophagaceae bacterium]|nr:DinB family protein [Chitinophagaceae bacterium]